MSGPFDVLMIDPPWPLDLGVKGLRRDHGTRPYRTSSMDVIAGILDAELLPQMAGAHSVFCWFTDRHLHDGEALFLARGYRLHTRFVWDKGRGPCFSCMSVRRTHEYMSWFYRGSFVTPDRAAQGVYATVICEAPRQHSRKPEEAYRIIEALYPDARKLDAFSRAYRVGWDAYGDQVDHFTPLLAPLRETQEGER